ncbi:antitoxin of toxin-antitoxin stability system [Pinirhizobacter sp.]|uniref:antitoxin of toxin-antitoxin stability system n=1 Tax=Pinirhizobacter sp. TaxID=2950432 RepID=UPI002F3ECA85
MSITMQLDVEVQEAFFSEVSLQGASAPEVVEGLLRDYVDRRKQSREYEDYLRAKIEASRADIRAGRLIPHDEVEAEFAAKRAELKLRK